MALTIDGRPIRVLLGDEPVTYLVPIEIVTSSGGRQGDYARFLYDLSQTGERVVNMKTPAEFEKRIVIETTDTFDKLFIGWLHRQDIQVDSDEQVIVTASVLPQDFGVQVSGMKVYNPKGTDGDEYVIIPGDIVFNPMIDGLIEGNMSSRSTDPEDMQVWCDPESVRTTTAETYREESASKWVLTEALHSITRLLASGNYGKLFGVTFQEGVAFPDVRGNPDIDDNAIPLENVRIPFGSTLPQALDLLTHPFGYDWYVDHDAIFDPRIVVFRRGAGTERTVTMQAIGSTLDLGTGGTNCHAFRLTSDIGGRVNKLRLVGSRRQWEMTIPLYRAWSNADDATPLSDLDADDPDSDYLQKPNVWRLWVANEGGDYCATRTSPAEIPAQPRDWTEFGVLSDKRRMAEDCLTKLDELNRVPPQLEYSVNAGTDWIPVPREWHWSLLETQLGVIFHGQIPPDELYDAGDDARLRITCTVTMDGCVEGKAAVQGRNAEADEDGDVWQVIDVSDRYHYRQVVTSGDYTSQIYTVSNDADEVDDRDAIQAAAEYMLGEIDGADMNADIRLVSIVTDYQIGDLITDIAGRNVSLNLRDDTAAEPRYLQVMGIRYVFGDVQETHLITRPQSVDPWYSPGNRPDGVGVV